MHIFLKYITKNYPFQQMLSYSRRHINVDAIPPSRTAALRGIKNPQISVLLTLRYDINILQFQLQPCS